MNPDAAGMAPSAARAASEQTADDQTAVAHPVGGQRHERHDEDPRRHRRRHGDGDLVAREPRAWSHSGKERHENAEHQERGHVEQGYPQAELAAGIGPALNHSLTSFHNNRRRFAGVTGTALPRTGWTTTRSSRRSWKRRAAGGFCTSMRAASGPPKPALYSPRSPGSRTRWRPAIGAQGGDRPAARGAGLHVAGDQGRHCRGRPSAAGRRRRHPRRR